MIGLSKKTKLYKLVSPYVPFGYYNEYSGDDVYSHTEGITSFRTLYMTDDYYFKFNKAIRHKMKSISFIPTKK